MRRLSFVFLFTILNTIIFVPQGYAFNTQKCPRVVNLNIQSFDISDTTETSGAYEEDPQKLEIIDQMKQGLRQLSRLRVKYTLQFAGGSKCYYEGHNQTGLYFRAQILMDKAAQNAPLRPWFVAKSKSFAAKVELEDFSRSGVIPNGPSASLHYFEKACPERGCPTTYTYLGSGNLRDLK